MKEKGKINEKFGQIIIISATRPCKESKESLLIFSIDWIYNGTGSEATDEAALKRCIYEGFKDCLFTKTGSKDKKGVIVPTYSLKGEPVTDEEIDPRFNNTKKYTIFYIGWWKCSQSKFRTNKPDGRSFVDYSLNHFLYFLPCYFLDIFAEGVDRVMVFGRGEKLVCLLPSGVIGELFFAAFPFFVGEESSSAICKRASRGVRFIGGILRSSPPPSFPLSSGFFV